MCENCQEHLEDQEINETEGYQTIDDRLVDLEIAKEEIRIEKEIWFDVEEKQEYANIEEFDKGVKKSAYYSGFYTGLINVGMPIDKAWELTINQQNINYNVEAGNKANETSLEIARTQSIIMEKQQL